MTEYIKSAHAKINLSLDVLSRRPDGYHEVSMVMHQVELADTVKLVKKDVKLINLTSNSAQIPLDERNIAYKAAELLFDRFNLDCGFDIYIEKNIPIAGGMAGGSTDAAAVLCLINDACSLNLSKEQLMKIGLELGADVPYCIFSKPALAEGIGEKISEISGLPSCKILLVNPGVEVSTKEVYETIDSYQNDERVDNKSLISCLSDKNLPGAVSYMKNVMQPVSSKMCPQITDIIEKIRSLGAIHAMMSGSGATCFGIFDKNADLSDAEQFFLGCSVNVTQPYIG
ncbi:MAG: 4-(cytidine 5'-diphospho)-2-C-methyl-D-erythritol kinase [Clostridia bacterium]|nr:4-(cytidine 5'-diphospho)-2-C-methyl-D-erythritol kinase [Clostridia bacterium]